MNFFIFDLVVKKEMSFKKKVTHDGQMPITIAHI